MRCPKCGAFMEEGKDICLMCGVNVKTYVPTANNSFSNQSNDSMFGSGLGNNGFGGMNNQNALPDNRNDYRNVTLHPVKNGERDIFDFFSENKKIIKLVMIVLFLGVLFFAGHMYYKSKTKPVELVPVFNSLYYDIDDSFKEVSKSNSTVTYSKSGEKGNACSITISLGTSTSDNHVEEYFKNVKKVLEPEKDEAGNVVDKLDIYTAQEDKFVLNEATWYYLNVFYRKSLDSEATQLRYKYLTSMFDGYFYDIQLVNNSNDAVCNASLDNFSKSLEFIKK